MFRGNIICAQSKIIAFSPHYKKDNVRLYEMLDIHSEIQSLMMDHRYQSLLGYFNSSSGVIPIINKLPHSIQEKCTNYAHKYKNTHHVTFPPFSCLLEFMQDISKMKNDLGFSYISHISETSGNPTLKEKEKFGRMKYGRPRISASKTEVRQDYVNCQINQMCPLHKTNHSLNGCRGFKEKSYEERNKFLRENNICFRCCNSNQRKSNKCTEKVCCDICRSDKHSSAMHLELKSNIGYGGEKTDKKASESTNTISTCTQICKGHFPFTPIRLSRQDNEGICNIR